MNSIETAEDQAFNDAAGECIKLINRVLKQPCGGVFAGGLADLPDHVSGIYDCTVAS
jgi:hypothetical protein